MRPELMRRLAKPMLFLAAFIWGSSFFIMKNILDSIPTFHLLSIRFTVGALLLALICLPRWKHFSWDYLWRGAIVGGCLFSAYTVQTFGLMGTTPSKNAFLTAVYCVIVPFLYWAVMHIRPDRFNILAALLCVSGVGFVSLTEQFTITWGDWLTLLGGCFYAAHIIAVAKCGSKKDIYLITTFQFAFAALYSWIFALLFEDFQMTVLLTPQVVLPLAYLCIMCTTVALLFQNVGQVWSDPASAAIILSLESVFGVICSVIFYGDPVTLRLMVGFTLIFVAVVCSETKFSFLRKKSPKTEA